MQIREIEDHDRWQLAQRRRLVLRTAKASTKTIKVSSNEGRIFCAAQLASRLNSSKASGILPSSRRRRSARDCEALLPG